MNHFHKFAAYLAFSLSLFMVLGCGDVQRIGPTGTRAESPKTKPGKTPEPTPVAKDLPSDPELAKKVKSVLTGHPDAARAYYASYLVASELVEDKAFGWKSTQDIAETVRGANERLGRKYQEFPEFTKVVVSFSEPLRENKPLWPKDGVSDSAAALTRKTAREILAKLASACREAAIQ